MIEINDVGAARTHYEYALMNARIPRQFWASMAQRVAFSPLLVRLDPMTVAQLRAKKRAGEMNVELELGSRGVSEISVWSQERSWGNLVSLLNHWNPGCNSQGSSIVLFSPNLRHAQMAAMTLGHHMLGPTFLTGERPYRVEVIRTFELQDRMTTLPDVSLLPNIMPDLTATMHSMVSELLRGPYKMIAATNQTPQQFYDTYGVLPSHPYLIHRVAELRSTVEFVSAIQGTPHLVLTRE